MRARELGRVPVSATLTGAAAVWLSLSAGATPDGQRFRSEVDSVVVYATVSDSGGRLVPHLTQDDFEILDDGRAVAISAFSNDPQPISMVALLDMSISRAGTFLRVRDGMRHMIDALQPGDRMRIGTFGDEIGISPLLTGARADLHRILDEELWPGGSVEPVWQAIDAAMTSLAGETGRRVVLVHTDRGSISGVPGRRAGYSDVYERARRESFMVYAISLPLLINASSRTPAALNAALVDLARDTGGGFLEMKPDDDPGRTFERVAEELRHQYLLAFHPRELDGRTHRLDVRVRRDGLTARARRTYVAARTR